MSEFEKGILHFNSQLGFGNLISKNLGKLEGQRPDGIVISGMGGSGLAGTILKGLSDYIGLNVPTLVWKNYDLPPHKFKAPFYIFVSFSGNTEEVLSGIKRKTEKNALVAVVTTGGKLKMFAEERGLPAVYFDPVLGDGTNLTPRQSCGYMYYSVVKLLKACFGSIKSEDFSSIDPSLFRTKGKNIAEKLERKIVLIYTPPAYEHLGYIWKININETSKQPSFSGILPEINHNEVAGFTQKSFPFSALFLLDKENDRINKKAELVGNILKEYNVLPLFIELEGENPEVKTWKNIILALWASFYLAEKNKVDPFSTDLIEKIKKENTK